MSYQKTTWNPGAAPGISADNLNKIELGIERTHARSMTTGERDALSGDDLFAGRLIFNSTAGQFEVYTGSTWVAYLGLTAKAADSSLHDGNTVAQVRQGTTKADVGLGSVENLSAASIRSATDSALGREVVSSFPAAGNFDGRTILLTEIDGGEDPGPYTYFNGEWL